MAKGRRPSGRSRRRRRRERRERPASEEAAPPSPPPAKRAEATPGVSWTGLIGGLMGFAPLAAFATLVLADPPDLGRAFAVVPALMAAVYVPPIWASLARTERRQTILRGSVWVSLVLAFGGGFMFGLALPMALAPATALLWLASGGMRRDGKR